MKRTAYWTRAALSWACLLVGVPVGVLGAAIVIAGMRLAEQERPR